MSYDHVPRPLPRGAPPWHKTDMCELCDRRFIKLFRPAHHCRECGSSVCDDCSRKKRLLPELGFGRTDMQRICDTCFTLFCRREEAKKMQNAQTAEERRRLEAQAWAAEQWRQQEAKAQWEAIVAQQRAEEDKTHGDRPASFAAAHRSSDEKLARQLQAEEDKRSPGAAATFRAPSRPMRPSEGAPASQSSYFVPSSRAAVPHPWSGGWIRFPAARPTHSPEPTPVRAAVQIPNVEDDEKFARLLQMRAWETEPVMVPRRDAPLRPVPVPLPAPARPNRATDEAMARSLQLEEDAKLAASLAAGSVLNVENRQTRPPAVRQPVARAQHTPVMQRLQRTVGRLNLILLQRRETVAFAVIAAALCILLHALGVSGMRQTVIVPGLMALLILIWKKRSQLKAVFSNLQLKLQRPRARVASVAAAVGQTRVCPTCFESTMTFPLYSCNLHFLCRDCYNPTLQTDRTRTINTLCCAFCRPAPRPGDGTPPPRVGLIDAQAVRAACAAGLINAQTASAVCSELSRLLIPGPAARCPTRDCGKWNAMDRQNPSAPVRCTDCRVSFCAQCDIVLPHPLHPSCQAYGARSALRPETIPGLKQCPRCKEGISHYRDHGCHHILPGAGCPGRPAALGGLVCGHHWCFRCGGTYLDGRCPCFACTRPGAVALPRCNCSGVEGYPYCSARCDCVPCPDCAPGRRCPHCPGCNRCGRATIHH